MGIKVIFKNTGHSTGWGYRREFLVIEDTEESYNHLLCAGRDTYLAKAIEKYIIKKDFLWSGKRILRRTLTEKQFRLLKGMCELGSSHWDMFCKAVKEKWTKKKLIGKIFYKVL